MTVTGVGGSVGYTGDGGSPTNALLTRPTGIAVSASGDYIIADFGNHLFYLWDGDCMAQSVTASQVLVVMTVH